MISKTGRLSFLVLALLLVIGGITLNLPQSVVQAAPAQLPIGIVDMQYLVDNHPDMIKARETYRNELEQAKKDFEAKAATLGDEEKKALAASINQQLAKRNMELSQPVYEKIAAMIKAVADEKGLSMIFPKAGVVAGGQDITELVMAKIKK